MPISRSISRVRSERRTCPRRSRAHRTARRITPTRAIHTTRPPCRRPPLHLPALSSPPLPHLHSLRTRAPREGRERGTAKKKGEKPGKGGEGGGERREKNEEKSREPDTHLSSLLASYSIPLVHSTHKLPFFTCSAERSDDFENSSD
eukprot:scaffold5420_cov27-Tisochrysis_lutea.AAC.1